MAKKAQRKPRNAKASEQPKLPQGGSDVALAAAQPNTTPTPGPSTQTDNSTTESGSPVITENNPAVVELEPGTTPERDKGETQPAVKQEDSTWTPAAALAPQPPATIEEAERQRELARLSRK